jgi:hypothetical protein
MTLVVTIMVVDMVVVAIPVEDVVVVVVAVVGGDGTVAVVLAVVRGVVVSVVVPAAVGGFVFFDSIILIAMATVVGDAEVSWISRVLSVALGGSPGTLYGGPSSRTCFRTTLRTISRSGSSVTCCLSRDVQSLANVVCLSASIP